MPFSLNTFGEILSQFQKYLPGNIPKPVMYPLLLVVLSLAAIVGYCTGTVMLMQLWTQSTLLDKALAILVAGFVFFLLAYALNTLQPSVDRWFQGRNWFAMVFQTQKVHVQHWEEHTRNVQALEDLYFTMQSVFQSLNTVGEYTSPKPKYLRAKRNLGRYHIIGLGDFEAATVESVPAGAIPATMQLQGYLLQHAMQAGTLISVNDLLKITGITKPSIVALTMSPAKVPAGLAPGDQITIYLPDATGAQPIAIPAMVVADLETIQELVLDGKQKNRVRLTLLAGEEYLQRILVAEEKAMGLVRLVAPDNPSLISLESTGVEESPAAEKSHTLTWTRSGDMIELSTTGTIAEGRSTISLLFPGTVPNSSSGLENVTAPRAQGLNRDLVRPSAGPLPRLLWNVAVELHGDLGKVRLPDRERSLEGITSGTAEILPAASTRVSYQFGKIRCDTELTGQHVALVFKMPVRKNSAVYKYAFNLAVLERRSELPDDKASGEYQFIVLGEPHPSAQWSLVKVIPFVDGCIDKYVREMEWGIAQSGKWTSMLQEKGFELATASQFLCYASEVIATYEMLALWPHILKDYGLWPRLLDCIEKLQGAIGDGLKEVQYRRDRRVEAFSIDYPSVKAAVAPTRIGNILGAVDAYCEKRYGLDATQVLPRMVVVMDPTTREQLDSAHEHLALLEWSCLGVGLLSAMGTIIAISYQHHVLGGVLWFLLPMLVWFVLYPATVGAARGYSSALRLAFETERGKVLSMSELDVSLNTDQKGEKQQWKRLTQWWVYANTPFKYKIRATEASKEGKGQEAQGK